MNVGIKYGGKHLAIIERVLYQGFSFSPCYLRSHPSCGIIQREIYMRPDSLQPELRSTDQITLRSSNEGQINQSIVSRR